MSLLLEWFDGNRTVDYPFEDACSAGLKGLLVDAYVVHNKLTVKQQRVKLVYLDPPHITLKFEDNTVLTDLNLPNSHLTVIGPLAFGSYTIYEWHRVTQPADGLNDTECLIRLVFVTANMPAHPFPLAPTNAFLLSALVNPRMKRVRRMALKQPGLPLPIGGGFMEGVVQFEAGHNMILRKSPPAKSLGLGIDAPVEQPGDSTNVLVEAVPGAGTGKFQDCVGGGEIKTIDKTGPDDKGNFVLAGQDCTWTERPIGPMHGAVHPHTDYSAAPVPNTLKLRDDCTACCDCSDFKAAYEGLSRVYDRAKDASRRIESARQQYNALVRLLNSSNANVCPSEVTVDMSLLTRPDFHLAISLTLVNNWTEELPMTMIRFCITPGGYIYTPGSGIMSNTLIHAVRVDPLITGVSCSPYPLAGQGMAIVLPPVPRTEMVNYLLSVRFPAGSLRMGNVSVTMRIDSSVGWFVMARSATLSPPLQKT